MLPPGHFAAGYLAASALIKITHPLLGDTEIHKLLLWGGIFGILPDIDMVVSFTMLKSVKLNTKISHRRFFSHAPIVWFLVGLAVYFMASSIYFKYFGLLIWLGSWSHFLFDSFEYGIMWLWPFSSKQFAFFDFKDSDPYLHEGTLSFYWHMFTKVYMKNVTFYLEVGIIALAIIVYFST